MYLPKRKTHNHILENKEDLKMTRFERDYEDAQAGNGIEVITRRRTELEKLTCEGKSTGTVSAEPALHRR